MHQFTHQPTSNDGPHIWFGGRSLLTTKINVIHFFNYFCFKCCELKFIRKKVIYNVSFKYFKVNDLDSCSFVVHIYYQLLMFTYFVNALIIYLTETFCFVEGYFSQ